MYHSFALCIIYVQTNFNFQGLIKSFIFNLFNKLLNCKDFLYKEPVLFMLTSLFIFFVLLLCMSLKLSLNNFCCENGVKYMTPLLYSLISVLAYLMIAEINGSKYESNEVQKQLISIAIISFLIYSFFLFLNVHISYISFFILGIIYNDFVE